MQPATLDLRYKSRHLARWADGTRRFFEAATVEVNWEGIDDFDPDLLFDLESEDEEFLRNFNMPIDVDGIAQDADNEMDTNADTTCIGMNFVILSYTQRVAQVFAYDPSLPPTEVPIVSGATAYDCPITSVTYILVVNEALYYGTRLDHSLWNPNQVRSFGNPVWDNPFDPDKVGD